MNNVESSTDSDRSNEVYNINNFNKRNNIVNNSSISDSENRNINITNSKKKKKKKKKKNNIVTNYVVNKSNDDNNNSVNISNFMNDECINIYVTRY